MKLSIIGATGSMSGPEGPASCYLVQGWGTDPQTGADRLWSVAFEMGPGSFGQLWNHLDPRELDAVVISHGHADHIADIISLQVYLRWHPEGPLPHVPVYGPAEIPVRVMQIEGYSKSPSDCDSFDFRTVTHGEQFHVGPMVISAYRGNHPVESYGFRIEGPSEKGRGDKVFMAYTGDTDECAPMVEMAKSVDLLLSECGFTDSVNVQGVHLSGTRAAQLALAADAKRLVLTHIQPWTDPQVPVAEATAVLGTQPEVARAGSSWEI